ncbi:MAG TPA: acetate--CoA ligase family protein [Xanthobacteraceae bacterium]|nr:acetate--CoA ligase family protein [Xanthobacteraceae bacterium]
MSGNFRMSDAAPSDETTALIAKARAAGRVVLPEPDAKAILRASGISIPPGRLVRATSEAAPAACEIGLPVAVKAVAANLTHKTDVGGVVLPVHTPQGAEEACRTIAARIAERRPDVVLDGFLIEAYRPADPEWILSLRMDPTFGPAVMFGLGGVYVDVLRQVTFRLAPLADTDLEALITEKPAMRMLAGVRGKPPADRAALKDAISRLSRLADHPVIKREVLEIEINPLAVLPEGVFALDALVIMHP